MPAPISPFTNPAVETPTRPTPETAPNRNNARNNTRNNTGANAGRDGAAARDNAVEIRLSAQAQNATRNAAPNARENAAPVAPPSSVGFALPIGLAAIELRQMMAQLGIPSSTVVKIRAAADGGFSVDSDAARAAELEAMLNNGTARELRNALARAQRDGSPEPQRSRANRATGAAAYGAPGGSPVVDFQFTFDGDQLTAQRLAPNGLPSGINVLS